jgi:hypothetical protein
MSTRWCFVSSVAGMLLWWSEFKLPHPILYRRLTATSQIQKIHSNHMLALRSAEIHREPMTAAQIWIMAEKLAPVLSLRMAGA